MTLALRCRSPTKDLASSPSSLPSCNPSSFALHGHEALITSAAVRGTRSQGVTSSSGLFATADAAGRCLVWQYRGFEETRRDGSNDAQDHGKHTAVGGDVMNVGDWISSSSPCHHVSALHTSTGAAFLDISFMPSTAHPALLVGAQGDQQVSLWDVTRGICIENVHRWMNTDGNGEGIWGSDREGNERVLSTAEGNRKRRRKDQNSSEFGKKMVRGTATAPPPPPSPWPVVNCVVPLPDFSFAGPHSFCFGGDDGCAAVYDIRSGRIEQTLKLCVPVTAIASAAGKAYPTNNMRSDPRQKHDRVVTPLGLSTRAEQLYVGDATGHVRWLDLRAGYRGSVTRAGHDRVSALCCRREDDALATIWVGRSVISDIIVPYYGGHGWQQEEASLDLTGVSSFDVQEEAKMGMMDDMREAAVVITGAGEATAGDGRENLTVPTAVWLDMKPFASSDAERIMGRICLASTPSSSSSISFTPEGSAKRDEREGESSRSHFPRGWFWRGEIAENVGGNRGSRPGIGGNELVFPYCSVGSSSSLMACAQLVRSNRFIDGAWRHLRHREVYDASRKTMFSSSSPSSHGSSIDRRVTRVLGDRRNEMLSTVAMQVLATSGNEVVVYEG